MKKIIALLKRVAAYVALVVIYSIYNSQAELNGYDPLPIPGLI